MDKKRTFFAFMFAILFVAGVVCGDLFSAYLPVQSVELKKSERKEEKQSAEKEENMYESTNAAVNLDKRAEEILSEMTLDEKIYQMMFVKPETLTGVGLCVAAGQTTNEALEKMPVGGIIYFADNVKDENQFTEMVKNTQSYSKIGLFIGVNEEGGTVRQVGSNENLQFDYIEDMADIGKTQDTSKAYEAAKTIAGQISTLGFNVDFAPVADVYKNVNNTTVKRRSFSSDTETVGKMSLAFVYGLQDNNICACLKYFPGQGNVLGNAGDNNGENTTSKDEIFAEEIAAFKKGIDADCDFVMSSHIKAKSLTGTSEPCSFSKSVVTDILKNDQEFENIVITDTLDSSAITNNYSASEAAVKAIEAGNDMILMPTDINEAFNAIKESVKENKIDEKQIDDSVKRILKVKLKRGIIN